MVLVFLPIAVELESTFQSINFIFTEINFSIYKLVQQSFQECTKGHPLAFPQKRIGFEAIFFFRTTVHSKSFHHGSLSWEECVFSIKNNTQKHIALV